MSEHVAALDFSFGVFALMTVMIVVIAGSTGIRMLFIDGEYRRIIRSMNNDLATTTAPNSVDPTGSTRDESPTAGLTNRRHSQSSRAKDLLNMLDRRADNRKDVNKDGFSIGGILVVGFATALEFISSLYVSTALVAIFFASAMIPFYSHAQTILGRSS